MSERYGICPSCKGKGYVKIVDAECSGCGGTGFSGDAYLYYSKEIAKDDQAIQAAIDASLAHASWFDGERK